MFTQEGTSVECQPPTLGNPYFILSFNLSGDEKGQDQGSEQRGISRALYKRGQGQGPVTRGTRVRALHWEFPHEQ